MMGAFWECQTCFEQHKEIKDADRCCDNRKAALEERAAIVAWLRSEGWDGRMEYVADCIEGGEHLK